MQLTGNTILITGGGSGIGQGLAEQFHALGNQVIVAGRDHKKLDRVTAANKGMRAMTLDIADAANIETFAKAAIAEFPALNAVIHSAGIMKEESVMSGKLADAEATIATNLLGTIRLTAGLLPHLLMQKRAAIMTVSSGLAFVPLNLYPTYCATKAAVHSYTESLRYQLKDHPIDILELIPPYVQTQLTGEHQASDPLAMPLKDFIAEVMQILKDSPDATEICVERVHPLRFAASGNGYDAFFTKFNDSMTAARAKQ